MSNLVPIIPTDFKSKLPHTLSWPVGAQELLIALAEAPQFSVLTLDFWFFRAQSHQLVWDVPLMLAEFRYQRWPHSTSQRFLAKYGFENVWNVTVKPVLRVERKRLHDELLSQMPHAMKWLREHQARQAAGSLNLQLFWDKKNERTFTTTGVSAETAVVKP